MTASTTHCWKNARLKLLELLVFAILFSLGIASARAQAPQVEIAQLRVERTEDGLLLSTSVKFELPSAVEEALLKGVAMIFVAEANIHRKRWYWTNKKVGSAQRHMRLSYQPLTSRWRLSVSAGMITNTGRGMTLSQNFDSLTDALTAMQRLSRWKIAELAEIDLEQAHVISFSFGLDVSQLPRPFQIGTLGQSEWNIAATVRYPLSLETSP